MSRLKPTNVDVSTVFVSETDFLIFFDIEVKKKRRKSLNWDDEDDQEILLQRDAERELQKTEQKVFRCLCFSSNPKSSFLLNILLEIKRRWKESKETRIKTTRWNYERISNSNPSENSQGMSYFVFLEISKKVSTSQALVEQAKKSSSTAQKRKEFLKNKKKKLKSKKDNSISNNHEDFNHAEEVIDFPVYNRDQVQFGERVDRPPDLSMFKQKLDQSKEKIKIKTRMDNNSNHLENGKNVMKRRFDEMIGGSHVDEKTRLSSVLDSSSTRPSSSIQPNEMEALRLQVQAAYKQLKAKRNNH